MGCAGWEWILRSVMECCFSRCCGSARNICHTRRPTCNFSQTPPFTVLIASSKHKVSIRGSHFP